MLKLNLTDPESLERTVECLRHGGVVALPTETVYGLMTEWGNQTGRSRIFQLKHRESDKPLQMLAANLSMAEQAGLKTDRRLERLAAVYWPGPMTVIAQADADTFTTIGLRIPDHDWLRQVIMRLGQPLAATSANRSGTPPAITADDAVIALDGMPDLLVDGGSCREAAASTVIDLTSDQFRILRAGPISEAQLRQILE